MIHEEGVAVVGAGTEVDHTVEVHLLDIVEVKEGTMIAVIVTGEVGVIVGVEVDLEATAVDETEETGTEEIESVIGIVKAGVVEVAEVQESRHVTVGAGVSV